MREIKNVLICGIGAIGGYYAGRIYENKNFDLRILVDKERLERYKKEPRVINGKEYEFDYVLPNNTDFKADLVIIVTKSSGLSDAIKNIKNFVNGKTIIMSFMNGVTSEKYLANAYGEDKILYSYLLGHTFFRKGREITHDGKANIIFGSKNECDEKVSIVENFFKEIGVGYKISDDIIKSLWLKFAFNCCANQISAITKMTFGQMRANQKCMVMAQHITEEIAKIALKEGVCDVSDFWLNVQNSFSLMIAEGKTSMLQDIESGAKPEVDIFGETVVELGKKYNIEPPYNRVLCDLIKVITAYHS